MVTVMPQIGFGDYRIRKQYPTFLKSCIVGNVGICAIGARVLQSSKYLGFCWYFLKDISKNIYIFRTNLLK